MITKNYHFSWKKFQLLLRKVIIGVFLLSLIIVLILIVLQGYNYSWSGFGNYEKPSETFIREKTLWDWLELFIAPIVLGIAAVIFNKIISHSEQLSRRDHEFIEKNYQQSLLLAEKQSKLELDIQKEQLRENSLNSYLEYISHLLSTYKIDELANKVEIVSVINAKTYSLVKFLDKERRDNLILFLYNSGLIKNRDTINLSNLDLSQVTLNRKTLTHLFLKKSILEDANFYGSDLSYSNFNEANLYNAKFIGANLVEATFSNSVLLYADFSGANVKTEQFIDSYGLYKAILPNGEVYNGFLNLYGDIELAKKEGIDINDSIAMSFWYNKNLSLNNQIIVRENKILNPLLKPLGFDFKGNLVTNSISQGIYSKGKIKISIYFELPFGLKNIYYEIGEEGSSHIDLINYCHAQKMSKLTWSETKELYLVKEGEEDPFTALVFDINNILLNFIKEEELLEKAIKEIKIRKKSLSIQSQ